MTDARTDRKGHPSRSAYSKSAGEDEREQGVKRGG